jgi:predicted permease
MNRWTRLLWMLRFGWRRRRLDRELDEEMRFHLDMLEHEQRERGGGDAGEAAARARRAFGNRTLASEDSRQAWGFAGVERLVQDLRFAWRAFRRDWPSTTAAVAALALGIGLSIAVFTVVSAVLLRPLPYRDPDRLVMVWAVNERQGWDQEKLSVPEMRDWQSSGLFESVVGFQPVVMSITGPGDPDLTHCYGVTPGFLQLLGVKPMLGRAFTEDEERKGGDKRRVLLRHSFWMRRYGGDPGVVGKTLLFENRPYTIVGVMGPEFQFFNRQTDLYVPTSWHPSEMTGRGRTVRVIARLRPGITLAAAQARVDMLSRQFAADHPDSNAGWRVSLRPVPLDTTGPVRPALWVLLAAVGMVLLIACANVANLLLAQGIARTREIALRTALGAGRARILRQLLTESLLLAGVGGALGYAIAHVAVAELQRTLPAQYSFGRNLIQMERIHIDGWVALFAVVVVPLAAVLFGLVPAWRSSRADLTESLKETGRSTAGSVGARRLQNLLVTGELALAVMLVSGAALLAMSFERLYQQGPGFRPEGLKSMYIGLPLFDHPTRDREERQRTLDTLYRRMLHEVGRAPGIEGAATVAHLPLAGFWYLASFQVEGRPAEPTGSGGGGDVQAIDRYVSNGYHALLSIPLREGRGFTADDRPDSRRVVVVNEQFARRYLADGPVVGRRLRYAGSRYGGDDGGWYTVVGVVAGERAGGMDEEPRPMIYLSMNQAPWDYFHLVVKSQQDLPGTVAVVKRALHEISPKISPYEIRSFDGMVLDSTWRVRYSMLMLMSLSGVALVMAALGVYGVLSYAVRKRTREIGIRLALGSARGRVLRLVTLDGMKLAVVGIGAGLLGACALTRFLEALLFGVRPIEPVLFAVVAAALALVVLGACLVPAWRASAVQPVEALRAE